MARRAARPRRADNPKNLVQSVAKALAVLRAFGPELPERSITEVAAARRARPRHRPEAGMDDLVVTV